MFLFHFHFQVSDPINKWRANQFIRAGNFGIFPLFRCSMVSGVVIDFDFGRLVQHANIQQCSRWNRKCSRNFHRLLNVFNLRKKRNPCKSCFSESRQWSISQPIYFPSKQSNPIESEREEKNGRDEKSERNTIEPAHIRCVNFIWNVRKQQSVFCTLALQTSHTWHYHTPVKSIKTSFPSLHRNTLRCSMMRSNVPVWMLVRREMGTLSKIIKINGCRRQSLWLSKPFNRHRLYGANAITHSLCPSCVFGLFDVCATHMRARTANTFSFYCIRKSDIWLKMYTMYWYYNITYVCSGNWIGYLTFHINASSEWVLRWCAWVVKIEWHLFGAEMFTCKECFWWRALSTIIIIIIFRNDANKICEMSFHTHTLALSHP